MTAFVHLPVLSKEAPDALVARPDGLYVDGTFGRGGHSRLILERLSDRGRLIAFDRDPEAVAAARAIDDPRFRILHAPFSSMREALEREGVRTVDGVFLDIGVSSPQIDDPARGFSFRFDGPLDMRMDTSRGETAAQWLARASAAEIAAVLSDYGEERFARRIAGAIVERRAESPIETTGALARLVESCVPRNRRDSSQHPATRTFQAIRIEVNGELDGLRRAVDQAHDLLNPGGRLVILTFHSLEDRIVKQAFRSYENPCTCPPKAPVCICGKKPTARILTKKPLTGTEQELAENPRAACAKLRAIEKI